MAGQREGGKYTRRETGEGKGKWEVKFKVHERLREERNKDTKN